MGRKPTLEHLRVFGSQAYILVPEVHRKELDKKSIIVIMVGYQGRNYRVYDPVRREVLESTHVVFEKGLNFLGEPAEVNR